jgi:GT2 family glycosyltransferase
LKRYLYERPLVSIIIPTRDKADILKRCVQSILEKTDYDNYEIIVVNNNSVDKETLDYFKSLKRIDNIRILDYSKEFNFSSINNFAVKNIKGDIVLFLNNDTEVISEGWMTAMLEHVQRDNVGAVGCKLLYPNKTVQHAGVILGLGGLAGHPHTGFPNIDNGYFGRINLIQNLSAVTAACMMMRKSVFEEVGGYDENIAVAFNDVDLCIKIREKGYLIVYTPYAELYHHESLSRGYEDTPEKQERFLGEVKYLRGKWGKVIDRGDPYYNPNLILSKGDFSTRI